MFQKRKSQTLLAYAVQLFDEYAQDIVSGHDMTTNLRSCIRIWYVTEDFGKPVTIRTKDLVHSFELSCVHVRLALALDLAQS